MRKRILVSSLLLTLAILVAWEVALHRQHYKAHAQGPPPDINTYTSKENPTPFTLVTSGIVTSPKWTDVLHTVDTTAINRKGDILKVNERYRTALATVPFMVSSQLGERANFGLSVHWRFIDGENIAASETSVHGFFERHALPEKNCTTPDPGISLVRTEVLTINSVPHPVAVIAYKGEPAWDAIYWRSLELGCITVKSSTNIETPDGSKSTSIFEPVSLTIGDPDPELFARHKNDLFSAEQVPFANWEARVKNIKTKAGMR
jgi:hypothetical protein